MIINRLRLCNFKNYKGESTFDFTIPQARKSRRNVILVGGLNGSGKTSILEAIRMCLYGRRCGGPVLRDSKYEKLVVSKVNKTSQAEGETTCTIRLDMTLDEQSPPWQLSMSREWTLKDGKMLSERFVLENDGKELEIVPKEMWEDYILRLIPPHISDFFLFDGERIKKLASGKDSERILRDAIHDLFNLGDYENLERDLAALIRRIRRRNASSQKVRDSLREREQFLLTLERELNRILREIEERATQKEEIADRLSELERDLRRKAGKYAAMRDKLEQSRMQVEKSLAEIEAELKDICARHLPFVVAFKVSSALMSQLRHERREKKNAIAARFLDEVDKRLVRELAQSTSLRGHLTEGQIAEVLKKASEVMRQIRNEVGNETSVPIIHDISETESRKIEMFLEGAHKDVRTRLRVLLKEREKGTVQLRTIARKLRSVPRDVAESQISAIAELRGEVHVLGNQIISLFEKRDQLEVRIDEVKREVERKEEEIVCIEDDEKKIEVATRIISAIQELRTLLISRRTRDLESKISRAHRELQHKKEMVSEIRIDPHSFTAVLLDSKGREVEKESISAGEQEIYAISVLWGLAEASGYRMPMIIDTPLAKLDSSHAKNMTTKFFPSASNQVILLSQDREVDANLYDKLKGSVAKTYLLSLEEENKITEGYFFE